MMNTKNIYCFFCSVDVPKCEFDNHCESGTHKILKQLTKLRRDIEELKKEKVCECCKQISAEVAEEKKADAEYTKFEYVYSKVANYKLVSSFSGFNGHTPYECLERRKHQREIRRKVLLKKKAENCEEEKEEQRQIFNANYKPIDIETVKNEDDEKAFIKNELSLFLPSVLNDIIAGYHEKKLIDNKTYGEIDEYLKERLIYKPKTHYKINYLKDTKKGNLKTITGADVCGKLLHDIFKKFFDKDIYKTWIKTKRGGDKWLPSNKLHIKTLRILIQIIYKVEEAVIKLTDDAIIWKDYRGEEHQNIYGMSQVFIDAYDKLEDFEEINNEIYFK